MKEIANLPKFLKILFIFYSFQMEMQKKKLPLDGLYFGEKCGQHSSQERRQSIQIHGVWALNCHYSTFPKSDSMEILKASQSLCQCDGRICRFSGSKLICGGLQRTSEEFSVYSFDSQKIQIFSTLEVHH